MKNLFIIWLLIFGTCYACIDIVLEAKRDYSISISIETTSENNEKTDTDDGILQFPQVLFFALNLEIVNSFFLELRHHFIVPEPRPPRAAQVFF